MLLGTELFKKQTNKQQKQNKTIIHNNNNIIHLYSAINTNYSERLHKTHN